jgi:hypothetical protein
MASISEDLAKGLTPDLACEVALATLPKSWRDAWLHEPRGRHGEWVGIGASPLGDIPDPGSHVRILPHDDPRARGHEKPRAPHATTPAAQFLGQEPGPPRPLSVPGPQNYTGLPLMHEEIPAETVARTRQTATENVHAAVRDLTPADIDNIDHETAKALLQRIVGHQNADDIVDEADKIRDEARAATHDKNGHLKLWVHGAFIGAGVILAGILAIPAIAVTVGAAAPIAAIAASALLPLGQEGWDHLRDRSAKREVPGEHLTPAGG